MTPEPPAPATHASTPNARTTPPRALSAPRTRRRNSGKLSITHFLTDGSLAALASALTELTDARVSLRDRDANTITRTHDTPPWRILPPDSDREADEIAKAIDASRPGRPHALTGNRTLAPIHVKDQPIGALLVEHAHTPQRPELIPILRAVAATVSERCTEVDQLRRRNEELSVLFALTSELVSVRDLDATLALALNAALAALERSAGLLHLFPDGEDNPPCTATAGLSPRFVSNFESIAKQLPKPAPTSEPEDSDLHQTSNHTPHLAALMHDEGLARSLRAALVHNNRTIGEIRVFSNAAPPFSETSRALLRNIAEQVAAAVASRRLEQRARRDRHIRRQIQLAGQVQQRLLPRDNQRTGRLDVAARYLPSTELGGDFYDLIDLDQHLAIVVADVVGKGVPAALLMASVRATFRAQTQRLKRKDDIETVLQRVNTTLFDDTQHHEFATGFLARINTQSLEVLYANGGHDPPLIIRCNPDGTPRNAKPEQLFEGGPLLGVDPNHTYSPGSTTLNPRDLLIACTDGVTEAMDFNFNKFTRARLIDAVHDLLRSDPNASARQIVDRIVWDVRRFAGLNAELDDLTVLALRALHDDNP